LIHSAKTIQKNQNYLKLKNVQNIIFKNLILIIKERQYFWQSCYDKYTYKTCKNYHRVQNYIFHSLDLQPFFVRYFIRYF